MNFFFKTTVLLFLTAVILSCNNDNDGNSADPIIGNWEYVTQFENNLENNVNDCKPSTTSFSVSGNRNSVYYDENFDGECVVVDEINSTWEKIDANSYKFTQNGFDNIETVTFGNSNNKLTIEHSDTDGNGGIMTLKFIYIRKN